MVEKRQADGENGLPADGVAAAGPDAKKPRTDAPTSKPALASLEALAKAKKALQLQKELKEKLKNLPQLQKPGAASAPTTAAGTAPAAAAQAPQLLAAATAKAAQIAARFGVAVTPAPAAAPIAAAVPALAPASIAVGVPSGGAATRPAPLRLDAQGREVDEFGNLIQKAAAPVVSLRVNQALGGARGGAASVLPPPPAPKEDQFFDPRMGERGLKKLERKPRGFQFVEEGTFQKQAEMFRLRARYGRDAVPRAPRGPIGPAGDPNQVPLGVNPNLVPLGAAPPALGSALSLPGLEGQVPDPPEPVPEVEWWDKALLATGSYQEDVDGPCAEGGQPAIKENKITIYIEHPVPIQPPAEAPPPAPQPLKLTARELKKLRTQRRLAREKEKQELIRQGLLEPPKPKVKLSNLYRVLGEQAVADPTALEMETRKAMAERLAAHEDRNLARQLTPAEKRDKKLRKMFDDSGQEVITSVYKVSRLDNGQNRFKVDINAKENHMSGVALVTPEFSLVVVEGCNKSTKRYTKLMLRRIDWSLPGTEKEQGGNRGLAAGDEEEQEEDEEEAVPATCELVWQGLVKKNAFEGFKVEICRTVEHAQQILSMRGVPHYWDAAKNHVAGEAPAYTLA